MEKNFSSILNADALKRLVLFLTFTGLTYWGAGEFFRRVSFNGGDSIDPTVLWLELEPKIITKESYVIFPLRYEKYKQGEEFLAIKRAVCLAGERLTVKEGGAQCNGVVLGNAKQPVGNPKFEFTGIIPPGKLFVMGDNERSWDSRYWGLLDQTQVIARSRASF